VSPCLLDARPVHALGAPGIIVVVRDVGPRQVVCDDVADAAFIILSYQRGIPKVCASDFQIFLLVLQ